MALDLNVIATGVAAPIAVLFVKTLLDFSISHYFVKWFSWIPVRGIFRDQPHDLSGMWEQEWGAAGSPSFQRNTDRHGHTTIKQFGRYCYAEFAAKGRQYRLFGKIQNSYLMGEWYDVKDKAAYFGVFELRIVSGEVMEGLYLGHSSRTSNVGNDTWQWKKC
ncbi:hypothetical protein [Ideonella sp.]|uniref:hypothetical protein n=1 Tax=Ideonella sp. TaxID=1929293 RepID=UPI003BB74414